MKRKQKIRELKNTEISVLLDKAEILRLCGRKKGWFPTASHFPAKKRLPEVR